MDFGARISTYATVYLVTRQGEYPFNGIVTELRFDIHVRLNERRFRSDLMKALLAKKATGYGNNAQRQILA
jgi:hypothetical protein